MSKHVPRHARWSRHGPNEYASGAATVRYEKGAWWAWVTYQQLREDGPVEEVMAWEAHHDRLGPFKRPRNAMMAAEERMLLLQRRQGDRVQFGPGMR